MTAILFDLIPADIDVTQQKVPKILRMSPMTALSLNVACFAGARQVTRRSLRRQTG
jgi:hypothetical protein